MTVGPKPNATRANGAGATIRTTIAPTAPSMVASMPMAANGHASRGHRAGLAQPDAESMGLIAIRTVSRRSAVTVSMSTSSRSRSENAAVVRSASIPCPVEAAVDDRLDPSAERAEQRGDEERRGRHSDRLAPGDGPRAGACMTTTTTANTRDENGRDQRRTRSSG